ncbi:hypothetical protein T439DRAFT_297225 [Meredithblackwellia eburnea MCA 4105]
MLNPSQLSNPAYSANNRNHHHSLPPSSLSASSSATPSSSRRAAANSSRKRLKEESDDSDNADNNSLHPGQHLANGTKPKGKKRNRAALSCTECKRRKIKCDRKLPCEACCKRGEEQDCRWEDPKPGLAQQPFALAKEHEQLKERVALLEAYILRTGGSHSSSSSADNEAFQSFQAQLMQNRYDSDQISSSRRNGPHHHPLHDHAGTEDSGGEEPDSDTEDAALVLEELALGRKLARVGSRARKSSGLVQTPPVAATPTPPTTLPSLTTELTMPPASRAMASLLVPAVDKRRKLVMDEIWRSIPSSKPVLDWLLSNYFSRADWGWHLHHKPTFMAEYDAFTDLVIQGRRDEIDPLWLAAFCMTLCLSVNSLDGKVESPLVTITERDLETLPWKFFEAAQGSLECGDWTGKPRIRTLQAIVLFAPFLLFAGMPSTGERHQTYLGAAIRISQQLGLHKLGSDPTTMPVEDYALPPGVNSLRREIPIRLFYTLLFLDYMAIKVSSSLPPPLVDCAPPGNFDDTDLSNETIVGPKPPEVATDVTFEVIKYKIALQQRRFNEILNGEISLDYETILDLDNGYLDIVKNLPPAFRDDYQAPLGEDITAMWRRNMVTQTIFNRILRLHRPFMGRGFRDPKYRYSTDSAIAAARKTLIAQQALQRAPLIKSGFQLLNIQGAVVVLFMNLWTEWPEDLDESSDHKLIRESVAFFESRVSSRQIPVRKIAAQSLQLVGLLFEEVEKRRVASEARKAAGGSWSSEVDEESYGHLLKRIGAVVVSAATAPTTGTTISGLESLGAASHIILDRPHGVFSSDLDVPQLTTSTPTTVNVDSAIEPNQTWHGPLNLFDSMNDLDTTMSFAEQPSASLGLASEFDVSSLSGPEYANPSFDWKGWTALDQLQFVGSF